MSKGSLRIKLETFAAFATTFLATDYFWYRQKFEHVNSLFWVRVLDGSNAESTVNQPGDRPQNHHHIHS